MFLVLVSALHRRPSHAWGNANLRPVTHIGIPLGGLAATLRGAGSHSPVLGGRLGPIVGLGELGGIPVRCGNVHPGATRNINGSIAAVAAEGLRSERVAEP